MMEEQEQENRRLPQRRPHQKKIKNYLKKLQDAPLPIGFSNFRDLLTSTNIFVDKTLFIKEIIDIIYKSILITRPRRWGKSINMNMLYYFFNQVVDKEGKPLAAQSYRVLFEGGNYTYQNKTKKLERLNIANHENWYSKYSNCQGSSPVIYMSWRNIQPNNLFQAKKQISKQIKKAFQQHSYLKDDPIYQQQYKILEIVSSQLANEQQTRRIKVKNSLQILSKLLCDYHKKRIYLLIDEYDSAFNFMFKKELDEENSQKKKRLRTEIQDVIGFIRGILSGVLKDNGDNLIKGILTGIFDILKTGTETGMNHVKTLTIADSMFSQSYGFSQEEIKYKLIENIFKDPNQILEKEIMDYQISKQEIMHKTTEWYNGYTVPDEGNYIRVYNPYAVINYLCDILSERKIIDGKSYWCHSGIDSFFKQFFVTQENSIVKHMLSFDLTHPILIGINEWIRLADINFSGEVNPGYMGYLLLHSGYITGHFKGTSFSALIPNKETLETFRSVFKQWAKKRNFFHNLSPINLESLKDLKQKMLSTFTQIKQFISRKNEKFFNSFFAMRYLLSQEKNHRVAAELHSGNGYIDNIFYPVQKLSNTVIIHEYKYTEHPHQKENLYQDAIWQIYENNYLNDPLWVSQTTKDIKNIITRGIVIVARGNQYIDFYSQDDIVYPVNKLRKITDFFSQPKIKRYLLLNQAEKNKKTSRQKLLSLAKVKNLHGLLQKITLDQIPNILEEIQLQLSDSKRKQKSKEKKKRSINQMKPQSSQRKQDQFDLDTVLLNLSFQKKLRNAMNDEIFLAGFKETFKTGQSLYKATKYDILQVQGANETIAKDIFNLLQFMKKDRFCFKIRKQKKEGVEQEQEEESEEKEEKNDK